jgi:hypothetical protein
LDHEFKTRFDEFEARFEGNEKDFENTNTRIDEFDKRFQMLEKRVEDVKSFASGTGTLLVLVISVFAALGVWNAHYDKDELKRFEDRLQGDLQKNIDDQKKQSQRDQDQLAAGLGRADSASNRLEDHLREDIHGEKDELGKFEDQLRRDIGKLESFPDIEFQTRAGEPLEGRTISASKNTCRDNLGVEHKCLNIPWRLRNKGTAPSGLMWVKAYGKDPIHFTRESGGDDEGYPTASDIYSGDLSPNNIPGGNFSAPYSLSFWVDDYPRSGKYPILMRVYFGPGRVASAHLAIDIK